MRRLAALLVLVTSCASGSAAPPPEIERTDRAIDLSGEWNDVDADLVAQEIIRECFKDPWAADWAKAHGKKPMLRLYPIKNKTAAYIDYRFFTKQIEKALVGSGKVEVLAALDESPASSDDDEDAPKPKGPTADFVVNGWLLSQDDRAGNQEVRAYLTSIEIIETESGKKAWVGQKRIRKLISH